MDVLLHRYGGHGSLRVPDGLPQLVYDISKEVLRKQPTNLYCFIADYLESLITTQEASRVMQEMMGDFFAELASAETGPGGNGPGGELDMQEAPRKQLTRESYCRRPHSGAVSPPRCSGSPPAPRSDGVDGRLDTVRLPTGDAPVDIIGSLATSNAHDAPSDRRTALPTLTVTEVDGSTRLEVQVPTPVQSEPKMRSALTKRPVTPSRLLVQDLVQDFQELLGVSTAPDQPQHHTPHSDPTSISSAPPGQDLTQDPGRPSRTPNSSEPTYTLRQFEREGAVPKVRSAPVYPISELPREDSAVLCSVDRDLQDIDEMGARISRLLADDPLQSIMLPQTMEASTDTDEILNLEDSDSSSDDTLVGSLVRVGSPDYSVIFPMSALEICDPGDPAVCFNNDFDDDLRLSSFSDSRDFTSVSESDSNLNAEREQSSPGKDSVNVPERCRVE